MPYSKKNVCMETFSENNYYHFNSPKVECASTIEIL